MWEEEKRMVPSRNGPVRRGTAQVADSRKDRMSQSPISVMPERVWSQNNSHGIAVEADVLVIMQASAASTAIPTQDYAGWPSTQGAVERRLETGGETVVRGVGIVSGSSKVATFYSVGRGEQENGGVWIAYKHRGTRDDT